MRFACALPLDAIELETGAIIVENSQQCRDQPEVKRSIALLEAAHYHVTSKVLNAAEFGMANAWCEVTREI